MRLLKSKPFLVYFLFLWTISLVAQLKGTVIDVETKSPLAGAAIYYDGTTIGVVADMDGNFDLPLEKNSDAAIVVSYMGYFSKTFRKEDFNDTSIVITLKENTFTLEGVTLEADNWTRAKKLYHFRREFLGHNHLALKCKIQNEDDIILVYDPQNSRLTAYAEKPILIINKNLGYTIAYSLVDFYVDFYKTGFKLPKKMFVSGTSFFSEARKKTKKKNLKARKNAYLGSSLHLMRAMANGELMKNKFDVFVDRFQVDPKKHIFLSKKGNQQTKVTFSKNKISILYHRLDQSSITILGEDHSFNIDGYGNHGPVHKILFGGELGHKRIASLLPLDYSY